MRQHIKSMRIVPAVPEKCEFKSRAMIVLRGEAEEKLLFTYYPDELTFFPADFVGMTEEEALEKFHECDRRYLLS